MSIVLSFFAGLIVGIIAARLWFSKAIAWMQAEEDRAKAKLASIFDPVKQAPIPPENK